MGPFGDYGKSRKKLLIICSMTWCLTMVAVFFIKDPNLYYLVAIMLVISSTVYFFGFKSPYYGYVPLLIDMTKEIRDYRKKINAMIQSKIGKIQKVKLNWYWFKISSLERQAISEKELELGIINSEHKNNQNGFHHKNDSVDSQCPLVMSDMAFFESKKDAEKKFQKIYEKISSRISLRESAAFILGKYLNYY